MKALRYAQNGAPSDVISIVDVPLPEPAPGTVRIRLTRSPIHNHDLMTVSGHYGLRPPLPATAGSEMLGTVDALGDGVGHLALGGRVATIAVGAWAEAAVVPAQGCVPMPDGFPDDVACQLLAMPMSAVVLLDYLHVEAGAWILQNAAGGAVGRILMTLAQARGINIVNLVRSEGAASELTALGAKHVVVTGDDSWPSRVLEAAGGPVARVIDSVCDRTSVALLRLLGKGGEYLIFGALAGEAPRIDPGLFIFHELVLRGFWMTAWMARADDAARTSALRRVFELATLGELPLPVAGVYALGDYAAALTEAQRPGRAGKVLFRA
ncbi:MAG: zinc-binding dehydrogenase [Candidatus Eremiobacteraeota bacterium]|nr:zinc-binding dehydrogenase [Candidatus Eremiobacteraeota bacterium]